MLESKNTPQKPRTETSESSEKSIVTDAESEEKFEKKPED